MVSSGGVNERKHFHMHVKCPLSRFDPIHHLIQAVKRNVERFPSDFMFQLSETEFKNLKSQIVISSWGGARRARPYAFTEQGVAMLSSVLRSKRAIQVNIAIMRAFVKLRQILSTHKELAHKLAELERKIEKHDTEIKAIFDAIRQFTPLEMTEHVLHLCA